jgi:hypothetical protein
MNEGSASSNAALTLVQEEGNLSLLDCKVNISVIHNNVG